MMIKKSVLAGCFILSFVLNLHAQQQQADRAKRMMDSLTAVYLDMAALKNPILRQAGIWTDVTTSADLDSKLNGSSFLKGKIKMPAIYGYFNLPIAHIKKSTIAASFGVRHQFMQLDHVTSYDTLYQFNSFNNEKTVLSGSLSFSRMDTLFNYPAIYSATASTLVDPQTGQYKLVFSGLMSATVKRTKCSSLSLGLILTLDPSAPIPVIPFIRYTHKFGPKTEFFADPQRIAICKQFTPRTQVWLSNNLGGNILFLKISNTSLPENSIFTTLEMKSGITYEHLLTRKMVLTVSTGINSTLSSKIIEQEKLNDPYMKNTQSIVPYAQFGISFLPFWKGLIH